MHPLAVDDHGAVLSDPPLLRVRLLPFPALFKFDLLDVAVDYLLNKLMRLLVAHLIVVSLTIIRENDVALLRAGSVLNRVTTCDAFAVLYNVVLGSRIFHRDEAACGRDLSWVEKFRGSLVIVLILECLEELVSGIL